jgi:hypothetical protein
MENPGFYKFPEGDFLYAPHGVSHVYYDLHPDLKDDYNYPVDGWYWFNSENEAFEFFKDHVLGNQPTA